MSKKKNIEEIYDPNGLLTKEEIDAIMEYRRTGKLPVWPYEELDWDSVGGIIDDEEIKKEGQ